MERLFDKIMADAEQVVDAEMKGLVEEETKAKFAEAVREGRKAIIAAKKEASYEKLDLDELDVDAMAEAELCIEDNQRKISKIQAIYKEWFGEDLA